MGSSLCYQRLKKLQEYNSLGQFILFNCLYKLITKTLTLRMESVADKLIHNTQTAFMKNRNIMSGITCLHEIIHETKRRKEIGIVLKLDFEKAYDKLNWKLLFECMKRRGFHSKWCYWIKQVVSGGTISVKVNNKIGSYIESSKGLGKWICYHQFYSILWQIV